MNKVLKILLITFPILFGEPIIAHEAKSGHIYVSSGPQLYRSGCVNCKRFSDRPWQPSLFIYAEAVFQYGSLEIAMSHLNKEYMSYEHHFENIDACHRVLIEVGYRYWLLPSFSLAALFSNSYSSGVVKELKKHSLNNIDSKASKSGIAGFSISAMVDLYSFGDNMIFIESKLGIMNTQFTTAQQFDHQIYALGFRKQVDVK